jgi:hypothetical protein
MLAPDSFPSRRENLPIRALGRPPRVASRERRAVMKTFAGGSSVEGGYYWNTAKWEINPVRGEAGVLPGGPRDTFVKVSLPALFVLAPAIGGVYALFLPFVGFVLASYAIGRKIGLLGSQAVGDAAATMTPAWRPGEAYLAGRPDEARRDGAAAKSQELDDLAAEVESKKAEAPKK